jgi:hypothetical protein
MNKVNASPCLIKQHAKSKPAQLGKREGHIAPKQTSAGRSGRFHGGVFFINNHLIK